jgi:hypothetical protein
VLDVISVSNTRAKSLYMNKSSLEPTESQRRICAGIKSEEANPEDLWVLTGLYIRRRKEHGGW